MIILVILFLSFSIFFLIISPYPHLGTLHGPGLLEESFQLADHKYRGAGMARVVMPIVSRNK